MRSVTFPYLKYKGTPSPIITFSLRGPNGWHQILAYVDSGASYSILWAKVAEEMGLNYQRGRALYVTVGDGSTIPIYLHRLPIRVGTHKLRATIGFSARLGVGFNLLGRQDIFSRFDVTFSDSRQTVTFKPSR